MGNSTSAQNCQADFEYTVIDSFDLHVFYNTSTSDELRHIYWEFGDGNTSDQLNPSHHYVQDGVFQVCLTIIDTSQCASTACEYIVVCNDCVWPGDANNDGIVNYRDILPLGVAYDSIGPARFDSSQAWEPHIQPPWEGTFAGSVPLVNDATNFKHADCNGDGIVNAEDTSAIVRNYDLLRIAQAPRYEANCNDPNLPPLFFEFTHDSIAAGARTTVNIHLGTAQNPAEGVYGLGLSIDFEPLFIDSGSLNLSFAGSEIGLGNVIKISKTKQTEGIAEGAIIRIDHQPRAIAGVIGRINFVMEDNLISKDDFTDQLHFTFNDVIIVDSVGNHLPVCPKADSVLIYQLATGLPSPEKGSIKIQPNPASKFVDIDFGSAQIRTVRLLNILGEEEVSADAQSRNRIRLLVDHLPAGTYLLQLQPISGPATTSKIIIH